MRILYLHGLASSPASAKATLIRTALERQGHVLTVPDLNLPSFEQLSFNAIVDRASELAAQLDGGALIGSSLGGLAALHVAAAQTPARISKLILLAPALEFRKNKQLNPQVLALWRQFGAVPILHSGSGTEKMLPFSFYEGLERLSVSPPVSIPTLLIHGVDDEVIDISQSRWFVQRNPAARLVELPTDHSLLQASDELVSQISAFIAAP